MEKFVKNGVQFTTFIENGERYLCTGNPTGKLKFAWSGEVADYCTVEGATSVVSGKGNVDDLYESWRTSTEFYRDVLGIKY